MPKLTWTVAGEERSVEVEDSASIGRVPGNTVTIENEAGASRRHCQILKIKDGYEIADLGSTNGTKVNGSPIKRHKLRDGDEIRIGETVLHWSEGSGSAAGSEDEILLEEPAGAAAGAAASASSPQASEQCFLVHAGGPRDGQKLALDKKRLTFGRNPKNTYVLDDAMSSGYHCEIAREGGAWLLRDLGSTNGTLVDGEPVTETALAHGARIRIGGTRFVFIDPTVSDFEKAMSAVEDLGSEWGLLRAEMDLSRVQKARRSQAVAIGGLVVVLLGAGYVAFAHPEWLTSAPKPLVNVANNAVEDFSFEQLAGTWTTLPESPAQTRFADAADGPAAQGTSFYAISRDGPPGRAAVVQGGQRLIADPSRSYAFGAKVRAKSGGRGVVRLAWLASDGETVVGRSSTDASGNAEWTEVRRVVARPARDASYMRIELANVGSGTAFFDDLVVAPAAEAVRDLETSAATLTWRVTTDAQATLTRGSTVLLQDMAPVGGALRSEATEPAKRPERVGGTTDVALTSSGARGKVLDGGADGGDFEFAGSPTEGRYLDLTATLPKDAALVGRISSEVVDEGIGVRTASGAFVRVSDVRVLDKVSAVTFGDRNRFEAAAAEGTTFRFALLRTEEGWLAGFGSEDGKLALRFDTDSAALKQEVDRLSRAAPDAVTAKRFGAAVGLYSELAGKLPAGNAQAEAAREQAAALDRQGRERLAALAEGVASAIQYQDDVGLAALQDDAATLATQYAGHPVEEGARAEAEKVREAIAKRRVVVAERRAVPFLARGEDYEKRGSRRLAEAVYRGIVDAYPGTEAAGKAQAGLERLRSER